MPATPLDRRHFQKTAAAWAGGSIAASLSFIVDAHEPVKKRKFRLWVMGDAHVGTDLKHRRESLADAIRQSEQGGDQGGPAFEWDIALDVGDLSGDQGPPTDREGKEVVRQYGAMRMHRREDVYNLAGNHDASTVDQPKQWWFKKWIDPLGESTKFSGVDRNRRKYPVDGTWERYNFQVGNLLFLIMSDRNDVGPPIGRAAHGGYPSGAVTGETFRWWRHHVEHHSKSNVNILCAHHHMLKETTVASGPWEGYVKDKSGGWVGHYHGYFPDGGPEGASYLYYVDEKPDAQAFERYLAKHKGSIDIWFGGHTHTHPDDTTGGRTHVEHKWGTTFINCAALTRYHGKQSMPMSRLLTFTEDSEQVHVQCYLHTSEFATQGWYDRDERMIELRHPFRMP